MFYFNILRQFGERIIAASAAIGGRRKFGRNSQRF
jgi:hypothetical protein